MKEAVPPKRRFLQEPQGVTSQKTPFFIVTAMKTSNPTCVPIIFTDSSLCLTYLSGVTYCSNNPIASSTKTVSTKERLNE
jgi:hypothetical protein